MFPGLDLYCTDSSDHLRTEGYDLDDLDLRLSGMTLLCDVDSVKK